MEIITFDTYENAIRKFYMTAKNEDLTARLENISPAVFRDICLRLYDSGLNVDDLAIFRDFFEVNDEKDFRRTIKNFELGKSKSVINFIKKGTSPTDSLRVEMAAILVGFKPRPYAAFSKKNKLSNDPLLQYEEIQSELSKPEIEKTAAIEDVLISRNFIEKQPYQPDNNRELSGNVKMEISGQKKFYVSAILITTLFLCYIVQKEIFPAKNCLQWTTDRFEAVSCKGVKIHSLYEARIIEWNAELETFRKLTVSDSTKFFINGKPAVWYSKENNVVEFFNAPGVHPITGKSLRPVTRHIVETYGILND